jgi:hydrogenase maturation protein HypF
MTGSLRVRARGVVQGVGFRPFVRNLAVGLGLSGSVRNDASGVTIEVHGPADRLEDFLLRLRRDAPALAEVERVDVEEIPGPPPGAGGFRICESDTAAPPAGRVLVAADTATCPECLAEMRDKHDRRYRYPFVNCTNCGPRYTIVTATPYDRPSTTMAGFEMCASCRAEYEDPADRRYHAQPVCCPRCGPRLSLLQPGPAGRASAGGDALEQAAALLRAGAVVAVKGLGGYHLAALASSEEAVSALRARKHREDKPFAVMVADLAQARGLCVTDEHDEALLGEPARPIVVCRSRPGATCAPSVAPGTGNLGLVLAYSGLHHLLCEMVGEPFVLTSGNVSDEPIAYTDQDALARLAGVADAFLVHDRAVQVRTDDSVARVVAGRTVVLRRSRGYAPRPVHLDLPAPPGRAVLAVGAEQKNTFCLVDEDRAFLSQHVGDLENYATLRSFEQGVEHLCRLFDISPAVVAHDLHPEYLSTKYAARLEGVLQVGVQHHHAHIASCLAANRHQGPVIGVAFDGLGLGDDGTLWGGELLVADLASYRRVGHLSYMPMPGGAAAVRQPWRSAAAYLDAALGEDLPVDLGLRRRHTARWDQVVHLARLGLQVEPGHPFPPAPLASSAGRLFDALGALVCGRDEANYEGQAAVELEALAARAEGPAQPWPLEVATGADGAIVLPTVALFEKAARDLWRRTAPEVVAARAHATLAQLVARACRSVSEANAGLDVVALSGGVFQNAVLLRMVLRALEADGFRVLTNGAVPPNDGGVSLGQAAVAAARLAGGLPGPPQ